MGLWGGRTTGARRGIGIAFPAIAWSLVASVLFVAQLISSARFTERDDVFRDVRAATSGWRQFDGHAYLGIAAHGYWYDAAERSNVVWFPGYPLLIRLAGPIVGDRQAAAVVVSLLAGLACALLCWVWLRDREPEPRVRVTAFAALFLSPYAFFLFGAVYADAVFLALVLAAFLLVERNHLVLAGIAAAGAAATRPTGVLVVPALVLLAAERAGVFEVRLGRVGGTGSPLGFRFDRRRLRPAMAGPFLGVAGLGAYMAFLNTHFGDPFAFFANQAIYHPGNHHWRHGEYWNVMGEWFEGKRGPRYPITATAQGVLNLGVLAATPFIGRRYGWGYAAFSASLAAVVMLSVGDFVGGGRYALAAFPLYALVGVWLARRSAVLRWGSLTVSALLMLWLTTGFARGWYLT